MAGQLASIKIPGIFFSAPSIWGLCPIRTPIYTRVDELNVSNHGRRYELSLSSSSHFLAFVLSKKNSTPPITAQFFIIEQNQRYFTRMTLERNVIRVSKDGMDTVIDRINSSSFSRSSIRLERGSERTVSRIAAPNVQRLTSRPATSNVFLSRRFIARFLLQDRGQCARAPFINR